MYEDIGYKIKTLIKTVCIIAMIVTIIASVLMIVMGAYEKNIIVACFGCVCLMIGPFLCYIAGFIIYGYGELIDRVTSIEEFLVPEEDED